MTAMKTSTNILWGLLVSIALFSCSEERELLRKIEGRYDVRTYESKWNNYFGCTGDNEITSFSVDNPGKIVFTGKKVIDGPDSSPSERPRYGYFDYEYETTDHLGNQLSSSERKYFQYEVVDGSSGSLDTMWSFIYIDGIQYDLKVAFDGNKVQSFSYGFLGTCYRVDEYHHVD